MALVMIATSIAGFLPAIIEPAKRRAPLTLLAEAHGIVFFMWLLLYPAQAIAGTFVIAERAKDQMENGHRADYDHPILLLPDRR
jgi:hypothetical protein